MEITATGVDLSTPVLIVSTEDEGTLTVTLGELVAKEIAGQVIASGSRAVGKLVEKVELARQVEIHAQVHEQVKQAVRGKPGDAPRTLADYIVAEARAQAGKGHYRGTATPLDQVIAAEVYRVLKDEVSEIVEAARPSISERTNELIVQTVTETMRRRVDGAG